MLVLSRKAGEKVFVGDDLVLTLVEIRGDKVRLGFEAPRDVNIAREEVRNRQLRQTNTIPTASMAPEHRIAEVRQRIEAGEALNRIEEDLDHKENCNG